MSSYKDHKRGVDGWGRSDDVTTSWTEFTAQRLRWLYGDDRARDNFIPSRNADLQAWVNLGKPGGRAA